MATTPVWQAAVPGQPPQAAHVGQNLGTHNSQFIYAGVIHASQTTNGATTTSTNGLWLAQSFATVAGQTTVGSITLSLTTTTTTGSLLVPTTVSLYTNNAGAPGTVIVSTTVTAEYANDASGGVATTRIAVPLPASGLTASTTYWLVVHSAGNVSNSYTWFRSNQVSGASTSPNGTTWTAQAYGFTYTVEDMVATNQLKSLYDDGGARWTWYSYLATGNQLNGIFEYTAGQTTGGYVQSTRIITHTNNMITGAV